jgi:hypothetical protein
MTAAQQLAAAALTALPQQSEDPWSPLRRRYFRIQPDDGQRRAHPNLKIPYDERLAENEAELAAVTKALANASGRAEEMLSAAREELEERLTALREFDRLFARFEADYRSAQAEIIQAEKGLHFCDPDDAHDGVASHMLRLESARARQRQAIRNAESILAGFSAMKRPVLPALASARESVGMVASLKKQIDAAIASRSADIAELCKAIES